MSGDAHVRICESLGVKFPRATRLFVRINGETHCLWRAVDHDGEVLEVFATKRRDRRAALKFLKRTMKRYGRPRAIVTDRLRSGRAGERAGTARHDNDGQGVWAGAASPKSLLVGSTLAPRLAV